MELIQKQYQKDNWKILKYMDIKKIPLNNTWVKEEISREILKYFEQNKKKFIIGDLYNLLKKSFPICSFKTFF